MAIVDSALDYVVEVKSINLQSQFMSATYSPADSSDTARSPIAKNIFLLPSEFNDSDIQVKLQTIGRSVVAQWNQIRTADSDNPTFNDSDFVGGTYTFRYKPAYGYGDSAPPTDYNQYYYKLVLGDSEDNNGIYTTWSLVELTDSEKADQYAGLSYTKPSLLLQAREDGHLDSIQSAFNTGDAVSASWNASAGAAFDFSTDKVASSGVKSVQRVSEGVFRVLFTSPFPDANYTVATSVGAQDYSGVGASPRQLAVVSRAADSMQVVCERTDDAANEDNEYMSILIAKDTDTEVGLKYQSRGSLAYGDSFDAVAKGIWDLNDSDWAAFIISNLV